jgi:hypothetical protein
VHNTCPPFKGVPGMGNHPLKPSQGSVNWHKVEELTDSMRREGWREGSEILVDEFGTIYGGHHRVVAAEQAGIPIPGSAIRPPPPRRGGPMPPFRGGWDDVWVLP